jgi:hypothetical protein
MELDPHNWSPLSVDAVAEVFRPLPVPWWIAGGWALDLFLGATTREHEDIDVLILRRDQSAVQERLREEWELFKTHQPTPSHLAPWPRGECLDRPVDDLWVRRLESPEWSFQIMLVEAEGDRWVYKRLPSIGGSISRMGLTTSDGVPYLAPDIQLLYKAGARLQKNRDDFERLLPRLPPDRVAWLLGCLRAQYPEGHEWIDHIERTRGRRRGRSAGRLPPT